METQFENKTLGAIVDEHADYTWKVKKYVGETFNNDVRKLMDEHLSHDESIEIRWHENIDSIDISFPKRGVTFHDVIDDDYDNVITCVEIDNNSVDVDDLPNLYPFLIAFRMYCDDAKILYGALETIFNSWKNGYYTTTNGITFKIEY